MSRLETLERICTVSGLALLLVASLAWIDGFAQSRAAIAEFNSARDLSLEPAVQAQWSDSRKAAYERSTNAAAGSTVAVLRIPSIGVEAPVFDSTGEPALNRGVGWIAGTAAPDEAGNIGIAGHRDGFFRPLEGLEVGAEIRLETLHDTRTFHVSGLSIVDPLDVSVLDPTDGAVLTLVTCYPFYYVGPAPDRFIVRATLTPVDDSGPGAPPAHTIPL